MTRTASTDLAPNSGPDSGSDSGSNSSIIADLTYIVPPGRASAGQASGADAALSGEESRRRFTTETRPVRIHDMRARAGRLSLDVEGFELHACPNIVADLYDDAAIERAYNPEIERILKAATGADRVVIFNNTRRSDEVTGGVDPNGRWGPAWRAHVDYTVKSGPVRAADELGADEARRLMSGGGRIVQVNVWRPIRGPVRRSPLALADAASIPPQDLIATEHRFPARSGEIYQLAAGDEHRWYYTSDMQPDEVILIKGWDSLDDGRARFTPHSAFRHPDETPQTPPRESIETRTYLVFERAV